MTNEVYKKEKKPMKPLFSKPENRPNRFEILLLSISIIAILGSGILAFIMSVTDFPIWEKISLRKSLVSPLMQVIVLFAGSFVILDLILMLFGHSYTSIAHFLREVSRAASNANKWEQEAEFEEDDYELEEVDDEVEVVEEQSQQETDDFRPTGVQADTKRAVMALRKAGCQLEDLSSYVPKVMQLVAYGYSPEEAVEDILKNP